MNVARALLLAVVLAGCSALSPASTPTSDLAIGESSSPVVPSSLHAASGISAVTPLSRQAVPRPDRTASDVFVCSEVPGYVVRAESGAAWIFRPAGTQKLPSVPSASGAKFSDGQLTLWMKGDEARLEEKGSPPSVCQNDRQRAVWEKAKLDGVDFRAIGNEPAWTLEIVGGATIVLVSNYGEVREEFPLPPAKSDTATRTTRWETDGLVVEVVAERCLDSMTGEVLESTVRIIRNGQVLQGCGQALH